MAENFKIACRGSWLSRAQVEIFKQKVLTVDPTVTFEAVIVETAGDKNQTTPLHLVEGKDFFTKEIHEVITAGIADFALHSMKDVSSEEYFKGTTYAVIDRDCLQDTIIFNRNILEKIKKGEEISIGTSSPRRNYAVLNFLSKALPVLGPPPTLKPVPIRGNVDTRLKKLDRGEYDGIVLAVAGINRLLAYAPAVHTIQALLRDKLKMVLPLFECPPAAGQGAIVAEAASENKRAVSILQKIEDATLTQAIKSERKSAYKYGYGCSQQFGTFHLDLLTTSFTYSAGLDNNHNAILDFDFYVPLQTKDKVLFTGTDYMGKFFEYSYEQEQSELSNLVFVANHKAVHSPSVIEALQSKKVWAAGSRTWKELAKKGIWVEGCADGLGLDFIQGILSSNYINVKKTEVTILTSQSSYKHWIGEGWKATYSYQAIANPSHEIIKSVKWADIILWTSYEQYLSLKEYVKKEVVHCSLYGKTSELLKEDNLNPIIFPGIKAFQVWREKNFK
ncbi:MAG: hydroxymethylbilane synthase [Cyclobacteriaceae bacterium]|nr:hydroxymethylbilane synthase [Cyclobacteriaceae bacterium]